MLPPASLYPFVLRWVQVVGCCPHRTAQLAVAGLVTALLTAQSLQRTALMRALASPPFVPARQRYKRVARLLTSPWLTPAGLTPGLVRAAVRLVPPLVVGRGAAAYHLALDSVRLGPWEIYTLGVVWHGRVLLVGWAVLPYPLPAGQFTPTVCALLRQVAAVWPPDQPAHLVADRAFPSYALFETLRAVGWGGTIRLQARHWVTVAGPTQQARALVAQCGEGQWRQWPGAYGSGARAVAGLVVVGRGPHVLPWHQANPGSRQHRARRARQRAQHVASKHPQGRTTYDGWVILFTTHPTTLAARRSYRQRWATEGTYRDGQTGWDGQHGWQVGRVVPSLPTAAAVAQVVGLWALGSLLQSWVGDQVGRPTAPPLVRGCVAQWTTSGRLSVWARGHLALTEPSAVLAPWLAETLGAGADLLATAPPPPKRLTVWPRQWVQRAPLPRRREAA